MEGKHLIRLIYTALEPSCAHVAVGLRTDFFPHPQVPVVGCRAYHDLDILT